MKKDVFIHNAEVLTPFGLGIDKNIESILNSETAYKDKSLVCYGTDFPVEAAGIFKNDFYLNKPLKYTKAEYLFEILLQELKINIDSTTVFDSMIMLYPNVDSFEIFSHPHLFNKEFNFKNDQQSAFQIASKNGINVKSEDIYIVDNTCSTGLTLMTFAAQGIYHKAWKNVLVCAIDLIEPAGAFTLQSLGAFASRGNEKFTLSKPFDTKRTGFIKTESASLAVLTADDFKNKKNALMKLKAFCQNNDGFRLTDGREDVFYVKAAMEKALANSNVQLDELAFIKAHGTSTKLNDEYEVRAIKELIGSSKIPITSLKGALGHTTDASGLVENLIAGQALKRGLILPTLNCTDLEFDINLVREKPLETKLRYFLSNSFGFGGNNASAIFEVN